MCPGSVLVGRHPNLLQFLTLSLSKSCLLSSASACQRITTITWNSNDFSKGSHHCMKQAEYCIFPCSVALLLQGNMSFPCATFRSLHSCLQGTVLLLRSLFDSRLESNLLALASHNADLIKLLHPLEHRESNETRSRKQTCCELPKSMKSQQSPEQRPNRPMLQSFAVKVCRITGSNNRVQRSMKPGSILILFLGAF